MQVRIITEESNDDWIKMAASLGTSLFCRYLMSTNWLVMNVLLLCIGW